MKIETRKGLWVSNLFTEKFGNEDITPAKTVPGFKKQGKAAKDSDLLAEVGESRLEDVAAFLENPPEGTDDGYSNIFYVAGCLVGVYWGRSGREWDVSTWDLGDGSWSAGRRAFGRNLTSETLNPKDTQDLSSLAARVAKLEAIRKYHNLIGDKLA